jgi:16S rRNA (guanine527-N7)-methyltransferase
MMLLPEALSVHRRVLEKWRGAMDLVGPGPLDPHFEDAVAAVTPLAVHGLWADLGSGAGFPGIALAALHPTARVHLVERRQKRAAFLEEVLRQAALTNAEVRVQDAEGLSPGYDGLISRAYKPPPDVVVDARRLLRPGGTLVLMLAGEPFSPPPDFTTIHLNKYEIGGRPRQALALALRPD